MPISVSVWNIITLKWTVTVQTVRLLFTWITGRADFFPSVNISYNLSAKHLVRAAYGRSVNRPEFREVVPYVYFNFERDANIVGNTELKNAYADNLEVRYEFYPASGEMITVGAFYKRFKDPIEETYNEAGSGLQYTYHNAKNAETFGIELV